MGSKFKFLNCGVRRGVPMIECNWRPTGRFFDHIRVTGACWVAYTLITKLLQHVNRYYLLKPHKCVAKMHHHPENYNDTCG